MKCFILMIASLFLGNVFIFSSAACDASVTHEKTHLKIPDSFATKDDAATWLVISFTAHGLSITREELELTLRHYLRDFNTVCHISFNAVVNASYLLSALYDPVTSKDEKVAAVKDCFGHRSASIRTGLASLVPLDSPSSKQTTESTDEKYQMDVVEEETLTDFSSEEVDPDNVF